MNVRKLIVLLLLIFASISAEAIEKIKLTGPQLVERIGGYEVIAGTSNQGKYNYMVVVYSNGTRELYWNDGIKSGTDKGTHRIEGDQICVTWQNSFEGKEQCFDVFKVGESKYESLSNDEFTFTYYKIR
ncbi:MAG: hypothetical protein HQM14_15480 [SAR324 cluster bacterium]|nr:hypothetical protein [SAR324 cluster bacterium]